MGCNVFYKKNNNYNKMGEFRDAFGSVADVMDELQKRDDMIEYLENEFDVSRLSILEMREEINRFEEDARQFAIIIRRQRERDREKDAIITKLREDIRVRDAIITKLTFEMRTGMSLPENFHEEIK
tara:strand:+ start:85 stop:462 length:378 start_codon:yes stop_codon:yes gene_type:complete